MDFSSISFPSPSLSLLLQKMTPTSQPSLEALDKLFASHLGVQPMFHDPNFRTNSGTSLSSRSLRTESSGSSAIASPKTPANGLPLDLLPLKMMSGKVMMSEAEKSIKVQNLLNALAELYVEPTIEAQEKQFEISPMQLLPPPIPPRPQPLELEPLEYEEALEYLPEELEPSPRSSVSPINIQSQPIQSAPIQQAPIQSAPIQQAPIQSAPIQQAPIQSLPIQQATIQSLPTQPAPAKYASAKSTRISQEAPRLSQASIAEVEEAEENDTFLDCPTSRANSVAVEAKIWPADITEMHEVAKAQDVGIASRRRKSIAATNAIRPMGELSIVHFKTEELPRRQMTESIVRDEIVQNFPHICDAPHAIMYDDQGNILPPLKWEETTDEERKARKDALNVFLRGQKMHTLVKSMVVLESRSVNWKQVSHGKFPSSSRREATFLPSLPSPWSLDFMHSDEDTLNVRGVAKRIFELADSHAFGICPGCNGNGKESCITCRGDKPDECFWCDGTGREKHHNGKCQPCTGTGRLTCQTCHGSLKSDCRTCEGKGEGHFCAYVMIKIRRVDFAPVPLISLIDQESMEDTEIVRATVVQRTKDSIAKLLSSSAQKHKHQLRALAAQTSTQTSWSDLIEVMVPYIGKEKSKEGGFLKKSKSFTNVKNSRSSSSSSSKGTLQYKRHFFVMPSDLDLQPAEISKDEFLHSLEDADTQNAATLSRSQAQRQIVGAGISTRGGGILQSSMTSSKSVPSTYAESILTSASSIRSGHSNSPLRFALQSKPIQSTPIKPILTAATSPSSSQKTSMHIELERTTSPFSQNYTPTLNGSQFPGTPDSFKSFSMDLNKQSGGAGGYFQSPILNQQRNFASNISNSKNGVNTNNALQLHNTQSSAINSPSFDPPSPRSSLAARSPEIIRPEFVYPSGYCHHNRRSAERI